MRVASDLSKNFNMKYRRVGGGEGGQGRDGRGRRRDGPRRREREGRGKGNGGSGGGRRYEIWEKRKRGREERRHR